MSKLVAVASLFLLVSSGIVAPAGAQIGGLIKKAAKEAVKEAAKNPPKDTAKMAAKPAADTAKPAAASATGASTAPTATTAAPGGAGSATTAKLDATIWENYDFVPGSKVLFYTDFADDKVGNFARRLKYVSGPLEVVERDSVKVLRSTGRSTFLIPVGRRLPERFTLELDVIAPPVYTGPIPDLVAIEGGVARDIGARSAEISWQANATAIQGSGQNMATSSVAYPEALAKRFMGNVVHLRILMDSAYFKMYANERRTYNIPELQFRRDTVIRVFIKGGEEKDRAVYVTSIRVAESETDVLYDALANKGRWATQGILFATGKSELRPESRPVLKEIAATLKEHGELSILIEGHTDNVGAPAANLSLSDARAAAVKAALVADFGISATRITTSGLGDMKPAAPNTTAEGRAQNRRVEIVKK